MSEYENPVPQWKLPHPTLNRWAKYLWHTGSRRWDRTTGPHRK